MARRVLMVAGPRAAADRATAWLRKAPVGTVLDAAAIALAEPLRKDAVAVLRSSQNRDGGWGETFDTAVAILAMHRAGERAAVERGRAALLRLQQEAGGWQETTRPPGGVSYAEHISTTAWALYALLETEGK
jgi:squalene cyclase